MFFRWLDGKPFSTEPLNHWILCKVSALGGISKKRWERYLETVGFEETDFSTQKFGAFGEHGYCTLAFVLPFNTSHQRALEAGKSCALKTCFPE